MSLVLDRANGDLNVGEHFLITAWCGARAFTRLHSPIAGIVQLETCAEDDEGAKSNTNGVHTVLYRLDAVEYPSCVLTYWSPGGTNETRASMLMTEFEARKVSAVYAEAFLKPVTCSCPKCVTPPRKWWRFRKRGAR